MGVEIVKVLKNIESSRDVILGAGEIIVTIITSVQFNSHYITSL